MTLKTGAPVPSEFIRLDDRVSSDDHFMNIHDLRVMRDNNNILHARRIRRTLASVNTMVDPAFAVMASAAPASFSRGTGAISLPIVFNNYTNTLHVTFQASVNAAEKAEGDEVADPDVDVYFFTTGPRESSGISSNVKVTVSGTTAAWYSVDVPVVRNSAIMIEPSTMLNAVISGGIYGGDLKAAPVAISSINGNILKIADTTALSANSEHSVVFSNDASEPRQVLVVEVGGDIVLARHPARPPVPGTDTVNWKRTKGIKLYNMSVYENSLDDFATTVEMYK